MDHEPAYPCSRIIGKKHEMEQQSENATGVTLPYDPQVLVPQHQQYWNQTKHQRSSAAPGPSTISSNYEAQFYGYGFGSPSKQQHPLFQSHPRQELPPPPPFPSGSRYSTNSPRESSSSRRKQSTQREESVSAVDAFAALIQENGPCYSNYGSMLGKIQQPMQHNAHSSTWSSSYCATNKNSRYPKIPPNLFKENLTESPPSQPAKALLHHHQSPSSDIIQQGHNHRRSNSDIGIGRGSGGCGKRPPTEKSRKKIDTLVQQNHHPFHQRSSSYGGTGSRLPLSRNGSHVGSAGSTSSMANRHRRGSSIASVVSEASMKSIVSDIRKSTFYTVNEKTGEAQLSFPHENVHLILVNEEEKGVRYIPNGARHFRSSTSNQSLRMGQLYKVPVNEEEFEAYHLASVCEDPSGLYGDYLLDFDATQYCRCNCLHCTHCAGKKEGKLSVNFYCLVVDDGLYRRLVDEISSSQTMPCGIFFCGHHEDVRRPSMCIPVVILGLFLGSMALSAFCFGL